MMKYFSGREETNSQWVGQSEACSSEDQWLEDISCESWYGGGGGHGEWAIRQAGRLCSETRGCCPWVDYIILDLNEIFSVLDKDIDKEMTKVQELIKANIQRSKVIQDQVRTFSKENFNVEILTIFSRYPRPRTIVKVFSSTNPRSRTLFWSTRARETGSARAGETIKM